MSIKVKKGQHNSRKTDFFLTEKCRSLFTKNWLENIFFKWYLLCWKTL